MQNAGQYGQAAASVHPPSQFVPSEPSPNGGSTTSSLRQFRKKDVEKNHVESQQQSSRSMSESHVARVAPHSHYPPNDAYRYQGPQFSGYAPHLKYSDSAETSQPNPMSTSVIQKPKAKDYMEMCNVQQPHLNNQQYSPEGVQYSKDPYQYKMALHKDPTQGYPNMFKPESQYYPKEQPQYQQLGNHSDPKFNTIMNQNMRKYNSVPADNPFLNKLSKLHPNMARSIISDHHLQDAQPAYSPLDQRAMYAQQNHRYYPVPGGMHQGNPYPSSPNYPMNTAHPTYANYQSAGYNYRPRSPQVAPRYPPHMERSSSPTRARAYPEGMHMPAVNYHAIHQKLGPNYPTQYRGPEYAQHYQHRRMPQDCFPQTCRPTQYIQGHHQIAGQDMQELSENTVSPSDSLKKFIENWADEDQGTEMTNSVEAGVNLRDKLRDDAPPGTVFMINANDVQYFENNGVPIVTSDNGNFQLSSDNYQYLNGTMVRIIESNKEMAVDANGNQERVVNLQIMETTKDKAQQVKEDGDRVVVHQNTVLNPLQQDQSQTSNQLMDSVSNTKELVDKNCSPINIDQLDANVEIKQNEDSLSNEDLSQNSDDSSNNPKSMPLIDFFGVDANFSESKSEGSVLEDTEIDTETKVKCDSVLGDQENVKSEDQPTCSENEIDEKPEDQGKPAAERRKRIFSVDDIMHHIGTNNQKKDSHNIHTSCSEQTLHEFIQREVEFSSLEQLTCQQDSRISQPKVVTVPGATVLLKVAGELMEITVKVVDGKKVINVKALSDSMTVIDCNHNYEVATCQSVDEDLGEIKVGIAKPDKADLKENTVVENQEVKREEPSKVTEKVEESQEEAQIDDCSTEVTQDLTETVEPNQDLEDSEALIGCRSPVSVTLTSQEEIQIDNAQEIVEFQLGGVVEMTDLEESQEVDDTGPEAKQVIEEMPITEDIAVTPDQDQNLSLEDIIETPISDSDITVDVPFVLEHEDINYPLEDEVFIEEPPGHEVIVADPLEGFGVTDLISQSPEIPLEPVTTTEVPPVQETEVQKPHHAEEDIKKEEPDSQKVLTKLEVQILSPTSTNIEVHTTALLTGPSSLDNDLSGTVVTKAAKKQYEPDLQVQHSTVSSSKKEERPKSRKKTKRLSEKDPITEESPRKRPKVENFKSEPTKEKPEEEDDEYVDFKELLRARKLKKMRKQKEMDLAKQSENKVEENVDKKPLEGDSDGLINEAPPKKQVRFSDDFPTSTVKMHPKDPRRKSKVFPNQVLVPSVSELIEENGGGSASKKKISLADYVSRKRKTTDSDKQENCSRLVPEKPSDIKPSFVIHSSDWEDSNSPVPTPTQVKEQCLIEDFSGLIKTNPTKPVIDINELIPSENRKCRTLQEYKDRVDLQLNSLSIQIPKKPQQNRPPCNTDLVKRLLNNEKLSKSEMEEIRKIIDYKKSIQQKTAKPHQTHEVKNTEVPKQEEMRLHIRKVNKQVGEEPQQKANNCGYSVINRLGDDGQPKIIFKRNKLNGPTQQPVVELVKLDLDDLEKVKEKYNVTVRQMI